MIVASTKERILQFIDNKGIDKKIFFEKTGIKRGFLDSDKLKSAVSDVFIAIIIAVFPDLNPEWLLTGKGEMIKQEQPAAVPDTEIRALEKEIIQLQKEIIALQRENKQLKEEAAMKSNKHSAPRPAPGKLTGR